MSKKQPPKDRRVPMPSKKESVGWDEIKARYIAGDRVFKIAEEYKLSPAAISSHACQQGWPALRKQYAAQLVEDILTERRKRVFEPLFDQLQAIAFSDISRIVEWKNGMLKLKNSKDLSPADRAASAEVAETEHGIRVKLHPKIKAIENYFKLLGLDMNAEPTAQDVTNNVGIAINYQGESYSLAEFMNRYLEAKAAASEVVEVDADG
jgi:hypothetical protein